MSEKVISISKTKIEVYGAGSKSSAPENLFTTEWTPETLKDVFLQINQKLHTKKAYILLGDNLAYTLYVKLDEEPAEKSYLRSEILDKMLENVPEKAGELIWDYKKIDFAENHMYQVIAINKEFLKVLDKALLEAKIEAITIEPESCALARQLTTDKNFHFILYPREKECLLVLAKAEMVYANFLISNNGFESGLNVILRHQLKKIQAENFELETQGEVSEKLVIKISAGIFISIL